MDALLKLTSNVLAYGDVANGGDNPQRRSVDWSTRRSVTCRNPKSEGYTIDPGATFQLFSGTRAISLDGTTQLTLTASPLANTRYRFTWAGVGTAPVFRTARALTLSTHVVTMTANSNQTLSMAATAGDFAAVVPGDIVFIPDTTTGDAASPFNPLNVGPWLVLSKDGSSTTLQLQRPAGTGFIGYSETVTPASNGQVLAYSAAGVQVGDGVTISGGFAAPALGTYKVATVTATWFEILATQPLPVTQTVIPGATGVAFYTMAKKYIRVEADQSCTVLLNGDVGTTNRVDPFSPADPEQTGWVEKSGPCWSASVVNLSTAPLNVVFISVE